MSLITSATTYDYESVSYLHEEKQRMFVWGRNIYLVQLLSAATPGMTSPVRKRVPVGQICNRLQAQMDSETGTTSTPLSPIFDHVQNKRGKVLAMQDHMLISTRAALGCNWNGKNTKRSYRRGIERGPKYGIFLLESFYVGTSLAFDDRPAHHANTYLCRQIVFWSYQGQE